MRIALRDASPSELHEYMASGLLKLAEQIAASHDLHFDVAMQMARATFHSVLPEGSVQPRPGVYLCIASDGTSDVGLALFGLQPGAAHPTYYIWDVVIRADQRRKGFGKAVMRAIEEHAASHQIERIALNVFGMNDAARALYQGLGYKAVAIRMQKVLR